MSNKNQSINVVPGEQVGECEKCNWGVGTYVLDGKIYSSLVGKKNLSDEEGNGKKTVSVLNRDCNALIPKVGDVVLARITKVDPRSAKANLLTVGETPLRGTGFQGIIRPQDVRLTEIVEIYKCFRPGDIVRASILSLGDKRYYYLSTQSNELGVVGAKCAVSGVPMKIEKLRKTRPNDNSQPLRPTQYVVEMKGVKKRKQPSGSGKCPIKDKELFQRIDSVFEADSNATVDMVYNELCRSYVEYKRKPRNLLQTTIASCLVYLRENEPLEPTMEVNEGSASGEEDEEPGRGGNLMNSTLLKTYRKKAKKKGTETQQQQQQQQTKREDYEIPNVRYADVGGIEHCLQDIIELIEHPIRHPEIYSHLGVKPPTGVLLHGPPGTGKTLLANAIAGELAVPFLSISAPEIVSGFSGQSEKKIRQLFLEARSKAPCLVFIDEIDAITPKRDSAQREMERRIVAQLLTCLDDLGRTDGEGEGEEETGPVIVIGATNRPDALDPALRRAGRFDREIAMGVPDTAARGRILRVLCRKLRLDGDFDFEELARGTPGFVGADLVALTKEAAMIAVNRIFHDLFKLENTSDDAPTRAADERVDIDVLKREKAVAELKQREGVAHHLRESGRLTEEQLSHLSIVMEDFTAALPKVQPSSKREGFATVPEVTWEDIGALESVRTELQMTIVNAIRHPEAYASLGLAHPAGVLLYGPPGCGKTLLARAVANECQASFISVKGPELLNKYVGESERAVRQVFERARASAPCVIFFDELDALAPRRGGESQASERVVNQLLTELDGMEKRKDVYVVAATNRPDIIDAAMLRPGRLEKMIYVSLPGAMDRINILKTITKDRPRLATDVDLDAIGKDERCNGFSGADLSALVREAAMAALSESFAGNGGNFSQATLCVTPKNFETAFLHVNPSVSAQDAARYEKMKNALSSNRLTTTSSNN